MFRSRPRFIYLQVSKIFTSQNLFIAFYFISINLQKLTNLLHSLSIFLQCCHPPYIKKKIIPIVAPASFRLEKYNFVATKVDLFAFFIDFRVCIFDWLSDFR